MSHTPRRRIGAVTFSRSEYSGLAPVMKAIQAEPELELELLVSGTHLSPQFGLTVKEIEADGLPIAERIEMLEADDSPLGTARSLGRAVLGLAASLERLKPDILLLAGDRLELLAVAAAAYPFGLPLAHLSGGEISEGAYDNQVRHALTKLCHLHFVATAEAARRLIQMGEEEWRVHITGEPALDLIGQTELMTRQELERSLGLELDPPVVVVTLHPTTLDEIDSAAEAEELIRALGQLEATLVITSPNADPGGLAIRERLEAFAASRPSAVFLASLGQRRYWSLLALADLMVGNSSSGIWEAPSFGLPVVNIGQRQKGRLRAANVIDAAAKAEAILTAIRQGLDPVFRASLQGLRNPYGDGQASRRIVEVLKRIEMGIGVLRKKFIDNLMPFS